MFDGWSRSWILNPKQKYHFIRKYEKLMMTFLARVDQPGKSEIQTGRAGIDQVRYYHPDYLLGRKLAEMIQAYNNIPRENRHYIRVQDRKQMLEAINP
jgi:hypothetical protein